MSFRTMADTKKKTSNTSVPSLSIIPPYHNKLSHSIGNKQKTEESVVHNALANSGLSHDFKQIRVHAPTEGSLNNQAMKSCPMTSTPRACPFGGACHICPAKVQTKLAINRPGDQYEQEADRVSEQIIKMSDDSVLQRKRLNCDKDGEEILQTRVLPGQVAGTAQNQDVPPIVHEVLRSPGQPLDADTLAFMEQRFGHDFSKVRVHTDAKAAESAQAVNALAYTASSDIVFADRRYEPHTGEGRRLLSHELVHVVQQAHCPFQSNQDKMQDYTHKDAVNNLSMKYLISEKEIISHRSWDRSLARHDDKEETERKEKESRESADRIARESTFWFFPREASAEMEVGGQLLDITKVRLFFKRGGIATVFDLNTGLSYRVKALSVDDAHSDVVPLTSADTKVLRRIYAFAGEYVAWCNSTVSGKLWTRRAIHVTVDSDPVRGRKLAASQHGCPHEMGKSMTFNFVAGNTLRDHIEDNEYPGHFCIHFLHSKGHRNPKEDPWHQQLVCTAAGMNANCREKK